MNTHYTAYSKSVNGTTFYFVKKFQTFPDLKSVPPVLEAFGMHTRFDKACEIAQIHDRETQLNLLYEMDNAEGARVIPLQPAKAEIYELKRKPVALPSLLKLLRIG